VQKRTRNGLVLLALVAILGIGLAWYASARRTPAVEAGPSALDAIPSGALLLVTGDLRALRASPVGAPFFREGREIRGIGKVRDVCGFDPIDTLEEVALAIPAVGEGEFGLAAAGAVQTEALVSCAKKVIESRGGRPVVAPVGSFSTVRDTSAPQGGEIAVRPGGLVLLGGGAYLRAMIDSADGRTPTIRTSDAHAQVAQQVGGGAARLTMVLTPEQRAQIAEELALSGAQGSPAGSVLAGGIGVDLGPQLRLHGVLTCASAAACSELGDRLRAMRDARAGDVTLRLMGVASVLERVQLEAKGEALHLRLELPAEEATAVVERLLALRGARQAQPEPRAEVGPEVGAEPIGEVQPDGGTPADGGAPGKERAKDAAPSGTAR